MRNLRTVSITRIVSFLYRFEDVLVEAFVPYRAIVALDDVANEVNRICLRMFLATSRVRIVVAFLI
ncbi:MAG: hypothetical protein P8P53_11570 [Tateyamaria sp.]|nr:hypothetical protein [Tateyamaria sp.]